MNRLSQLTETPQGNCSCYGGLWLSQLQIRPPNTVQIGLKESGKTAPVYDVKARQGDSRTHTPLLSPPQRFLRSSEMCAGVLGGGEVGARTSLTLERYTPGTR